LKNLLSQKHSPLVNLILFVITFITTIFAGLEWTTGTPGPYDITALANGLPYALSILLILSVHEFGHYFAARYHKVDATFPYFIPFPPIMGFLNFGTMGAVIRTRSTVMNNKAMFDIGVAGPIAGFFASLIILIYGFTHLPSVDYLLAIHPDYFQPEYAEGVLSLRFGDTLLMTFLRDTFTNSNQFVPPMTEIYHYPYLCAGWFGLFITSMNMILVGQLDGGHISYSMFGTVKQEAIASISMIFLIVLGVLGTVETFLELNIGIGWTGWLFWSFILYFVIKVKHPPVANFSPLDFKRMALGYFSFFILVVSFSPAPFIISIS